MGLPLIPVGIRPWLVTAWRSLLAACLAVMAAATLTLLASGRAAHSLARGTASVRQVPDAVPAPPPAVTAASAGTAGMPARVPVLEPATAQRIGSPAVPQPSPAAGPVNIRPSRTPPPVTVTVTAAPVRVTATATVTPTAETTITTSPPAPSPDLGTTTPSPPASPDPETTSPAPDGSPP